jgi:hypothetical protein
VRVANPVSFLSQKILIQDVRDRKDRAKDILYIHDTIEIFAGHLAELRELDPLYVAFTTMSLYPVAAQL